MREVCWRGHLAVAWCGVKLRIRPVAPTRDFERSWRCFIRPPPAPRRPLRAMQEPGPPSPARADGAAPQAPLRKESSSSSVSRTDELRNSGRGNISRKSSSNDVLSVSQRNEAELSKLSNEELRRATILTADKLYKLRQHQQVRNTFALINFCFCIRRAHDAQVTSIHRCSMRFSLVTSACRKTLRFYGGCAGRTLI